MGLHRNLTGGSSIVTGLAALRKRQIGSENFLRLELYHWKGRTIRARLHRPKVIPKMFSDRFEMSKTLVVH